MARDAVKYRLSPVYIDLLSHDKIRYWFSLRQDSLKESMESWFKSIPACRSRGKQATFFEKVPVPVLVPSGPSGWKMAWDLSCYQVHCTQMSPTIHLCFACALEDEYRRKKCSNCELRTVAGHVNEPDMRMPQVGRDRDDPGRQDFSITVMQRNAGELAIV